MYTAIISDLHLTDPEPPRHKTKSRHPLWKKFKTKDFYIDESLVQFIDHIQKQAGENNPDSKVELVLNGDIFDFDSDVTFTDSVSIEIPPLLLSYLRAGSKVYGKPALDKDFGCIDFMTILNLKDLTRFYKKRYFREAL